MKKSNAGITLMELIVVLAIIVIIGAIITPNFFAMQDRARVRSDIQSTVVLRNALSLQILETGENVSGSISDILGSLYDGNYISFEVSSSGDNGPQTLGAQWILSNNQIYLSIPSELYQNIDLTPQESSVITSH